MLTQLQRENKIHFPHTGWRTLCEEIPWSLLQPSVCFHYHLIIVQHKHDSKWSYTYWVVLTSSGFRGKPPQRLSQDYTFTACLQAPCIAWTPAGMRFWPHRSNSRQKCISIYKHCASFCHKLCQKNNLKGKTPFNFNVFALGIQLFVSYWWSTCLRKGVTKHLLNFEIAVWQEPHTANQLFTCTESGVSRIHQIQQNQITIFQFEWKFSIYFHQGFLSA